MSDGALCSVALLDFYKGLNMKTYESPHVEIVDFIPQTILKSSGTQMFQIYYCPIKRNFKCKMKSFPDERACFRSECIVYMEWSYKQYLTRRYGAIQKTK